MRRTSPFVPDGTLALCLATSLVFCVGCVERKLTVRSDPPGASVVLDGNPIGQTPVTVRFDEYGGREVILSKPKHYRERRIARLRPPFYQRLGVDLFFELVWPFMLTDEQVLDFQLRPIPQSEPDQAEAASLLEARAKDLESRAHEYGSEGR